MNKRELFVIVLLFALTVSFALLIRPTQTESVCIKDSCFEVELAITLEERQQGLMFRESLDEDKGMLFLFEEEGLYPFWMKNTQIPLDIIWIDESLHIVRIIHEASPCNLEQCPTINPGVNASYVLEINGGIAEAKGIAKGDKVAFR